MNYAINQALAVGLRLILLRRRESGPIRPDFSLRSPHYAPRNRHELLSLSHSPRYEHLSPTGSQVVFTLMIPFRMKMDEIFAEC